MGRAGCSGREKDCLKSVGTGVGVSNRIYDSNSLRDRAREGPGSERRHAGTVDGMSPSGDTERPWDTSAGTYIPTALQLKPPGGRKYPH